MLKRHFLWILYAIFVAIAIAFKGNEPLFIGSGSYALGKPILWGVLGAFLGYSLYCHSKENFFKTMGITGKFHWTKQIGVDLYIGVGLVAFLIFILDGPIVLALWAIPLLIYANLATLLYLAMNYERILAAILS